MRYVILRDDDANATTSTEMLERLYRPFLDDGMPVHLATIPEVRADIRRPDGEIEGFLLGEARGTDAYLPIAENDALIAYLAQEPGYRVVQHGFHHEFVNGRSEFAVSEAAEVRRRLNAGASRLREAGFAPSKIFVAPQDQWSAVAFDEVARAFPIISGGWLSLSRLPRRYWPAYLAQKKLQKRSHLRLGDRTVMTHPGCILSYHRDAKTIVPTLVNEILSRSVTVVVSHHWEYFDGGVDNKALIDALFELHAWIKGRSDVQVVRYEDAVAYA